MRSVMRKSSKTMKNLSDIPFFYCGEFACSGAKKEGSTEEDGRGCCCQFIFFGAMGNSPSSKSPQQGSYGGNDDNGMLACFGEQAEMTARKIRIMKILRTPQPRRKRKTLQAKANDPHATAEYFISEVTFRKKKFGEIFDFYSSDQNRLYMDKLRVLVAHVELNADFDPVTLPTEHMRVIIEKMGGTFDAAVPSKSYIKRDTFVESMFQAMNLKSYDEKKFDRIVVPLAIRGEHANDEETTLVKQCIVHIWDAFDWNGDGRMNRDEFGAFAIKAFGDGSEETCDDMFMMVLKLESKEEMHEHLGLRIHDFISWLWETLVDESTESRWEILEQFIDLAMEQPGANIRKLASLLERKKG